MAIRHLNDLKIQEGDLQLQVGSNAAPQSYDKIHIGGDGLASADAAIYIGNRGDGSGYGYRMYYSGTGSGNNNKLIFKSENLGSPVDMLSFTADGNATFSGTITTGSHGTSANWKDAYDNYITNIAVTGTSTKTITLTQRDGGTISANFSDQSGSGGINMTNGVNNRVVTAVDLDTVNGEAGLLFGGSYLEITPGNIATPLQVKRTSASTRQVNLLLSANDGSSTSEGFLGIDSGADLRYGGSSNTSANSLILTEDNLDFVVSSSTNNAIVRLAGGGTNFANFSIGGAAGAITVNSGTNSITIGHHDTSSASTVNNSGNTVIQDVTLDTYGHVTGLSSKTLTIPTVYNGTLTVQGTGALGGSGTFTANQSTNATISISHDDTSSQSTVNNSNGTVIQDVTLDGYGHVTGLGSTNLDNRYVLKAGGTFEGDITIEGSIQVDDGFSSDGVSPFHSWRAIQNTASSSNQYYRIARIYASQSSRFIIELAGRSSSYGDTSLPAFGKIVGQLNNDNNYDIVYYNASATDEVVDEVGQVDVDTARTDIYVRVGQFAELTATAHISDGSITPYDTNSGSTSAPTGYVQATEYKLWNTGNDGSGSGLDADTLDGNHASAFLTSESDTLATVTGRGASTTTSCTFNTITMNTPVVGSSNKIKFANNDYIRFDDTANRFHFDVDGGTNNASLQAATFVGALNATGGISGLTLTNGISGNNFNISGVNQLSINDPGEGIVFGGGSAGDITLAVVDDSSDNIVRFTNAAYLQVGTSTVWHAGNDGAGTGLDADLLDGQQGSYYLNYNNFTNTPTIPTVNNATLTVQGTGALGGSGTFTANQSSNATISISHDDTSSQNSVNNSSGTVIQDVTLDGYGHVTSLGSVNLDGRYYTESEIQTFFNRGYVSKHSASNLAVGWYTIATNTGDRALGEFQIWDTASGDHQSVLFNATHHYGRDASNDITVLANSRYSGTNFRYIRIKENGTYDGAAVQVYVDGTSNAVNVAIVGANAQTSGWVIKDWVADATDPGDVSSWSNFSERCRVDLDNIIDGGVMTTGPIYSGGSTTQYRVLNTSDEGAGNGLDADTLDGQHGSYYLDYNNFTNTPSSGGISQSDADTRYINTTGDTMGGTLNMGGNTLTLHTSGGSPGLKSYYGTVNVINGSSAGTLYVGTGNANASGSVYATTIGGGSNTKVVYSTSHHRYYVGSSTEEMRLESDGDLHVEGDVTAYSTTVSDIRLKDNVVTINNALDKVCKLRGVEYTWNKGSRKDTRDLGVIAQEVEKVLPEIVKEKKMPLIDDSDTTYKAVDYEKITAVLVEAVKEQQAQIDELTTILEEVTKQLNNGNNV